MPQRPGAPTTDLDALLKEADDALATSSTRPQTAAPDLDALLKEADGALASAQAADRLRAKPAPVTPTLPATGPSKFFQNPLDRMPSTPVTAHRRAIPGELKPVASHTTQQQTQQDVARTLRTVHGQPQNPLPEMTTRPRPKPIEKFSTAGRAANDTVVALLKGMAAIPPAAVGLADLTLSAGARQFNLPIPPGVIGHEIQRAGVDLGAQARNLETHYSPETQAGHKAVQDADGVLATAAAALSHPSSIATATLESLPLMVAGGAVGRVAGAMGSSAATAGAIGEGAMAGGAAAESIRAQSPGGLITPGQQATAIVSGATTGAIGRFSAALATKLGIADVDTMLAAGLVNPTAGRSLVRSILAVAAGAGQEGLLEELPQSVSEAVLENLALGQPLDKDLDHTAVMGALAGAAMGGPIQIMDSLGQPAPPVDVFDRAAAFVSRAPQAATNPAFWQAGGAAISASLDAGAGLSTSRAAVALGKVRTNGTPGADLIAQGALAYGDAIAAGRTPEEAAQLAAQAVAAASPAGDVQIPTSAGPTLDLPLQGSETPEPTVSIDTAANPDAIIAAADEALSEVAPELGPEFAPVDAPTAPVEAPVFPEPGGDVIDRIGQKLVSGEPIGSPELRQDFAERQRVEEVRRGEAPTAPENPEGISDAAGNSPSISGALPAELAPPPEDPDDVDTPLAQPSGRSSTPDAETGPVLPIDNAPDSARSSTEPDYASMSEDEFAQAILREMEQGAAPPPTEEPAAPPIPKAHAKLEADEPGIRERREPVVFRSGNQKAPADLAGYIKAGQPVGITADAQYNVYARAAQYAENGGQVFVDSGAFAERTTGVAPNFEKILTFYEDFATRLAVARDDVTRNLYVVAPDKVGDADATRARQELYADRIDGLLERGVNVIVPVQMGNHAYDAGQVAKRWPTALIGIPANKDAATVEDLERIAAEITRATGQAPGGFHFLGMGERNPRFDAFVEVVRKHFPDVRITSDSNRTRAMMAPGRPAQVESTERTRDMVDGIKETSTLEPGDGEHQALRMLRGAWANPQFHKQVFTPKELKALKTAESVEEEEGILRSIADGRLKGHVGPMVRTEVIAKHDAKAPTPVTPREPAGAPLSPVEETRLRDLRAMDDAGTEMDEDVVYEFMALEERVPPAFNVEHLTDHRNGESKDWPTMHPDDNLQRDPDRVVSLPLFTSGRKPDVITPEQAAAKLAEWKAEAARIGRDEDHSREVIISLFDRTGRWSQPYVDAGYTVVRYDKAHGDDLIESIPIADIQELKDKGYTVVGVMAAPPCTSFTVSGARWWADQHDKADQQMVEKKYGYRASRYFDTPLDYANTLVRAVELVIELANPTQFYAMENPVGRIADQNDLPKPALSFDPAHFGDPYTKRTLLWGNFNPDLPLAPVDPTQGSYVANLRGDNPEQKALRSVTPEGFAYAFFMANHQRAAERAQVKAKPSAPVTPKAAPAAGPTIDYAQGAVQVTFPDKPSEAVRSALKGLGFRWGKGHWYKKADGAKRTQLEAAVRQALGIVESAKPAPPAKPAKPAPPAKPATPAPPAKPAIPVTPKATPQVEAPAGSKFVLPSFATNGTEKTGQSEQDGDVSPFTTPGTRLTWGTGQAWADALRTLDSRPSSSTRHKQIRQHLEELSRHPDFIAAQGREDLEAIREAMLAQNNMVPPRGKRAGTPYELVINEVNNALARLDAPEKPKSAARQAIADKLKDGAAERQALMDEILGELKNRTNTGLDPKIAMLTARLAQKYVKAGFLKFADATLAAHEEFGADVLKKIQPYWEAAWRLLKDPGSVDAVLAEAQNQAEVDDDDSRDTTPGSDGDRPGEPADAGRAAADAVRNDDAGSLDPVSAESGGQPEPAGTDRAGRSDSPSGAPGGVPDSTGPQPGSDPTPGPGPRAVPGGSLPAAGSVADYQLTPERIAGIINRGDVQRFKDNVAAIRLVQQLQQEQRAATPDEQEVLAKYVGWGASALAQYLEDSPRYGWSKPEKTTWEELRSLTTAEQREALKRSSPNAHFTYDLYRPIWRALARFGFTGGRVLEPAIGMGHALGFMEPDVRANSTINASELEPLTAAMAGYLYPSAKVQAVGYQNIRLPRNTQDLVISNVPFGPFGVKDTMFSGAAQFVTERIHSYFFAKALEHARPGGYVVFVTSRYTMDGPEHRRIREYLMDRAHFLGAVRLPNTAFGKSAKTEVITDLIVLQKHKEGDARRPEAELFVESPKQDQLSGMVRGKRGKEVEKVVYRSAWYDKHQHLILGRESNGGTMYGAGEYTVEAYQDADVDGLLNHALQTLLPADAYQPATTDSTDSEVPTVVQDAFKPGELRVDGKKIVAVRADGSTFDVTPTRNTERAVARIAGMIGVRDARRAVIATMLRPTSTDREVKAAQGKLQKAYDAFVKEYGVLNSVANVAAFKLDPEIATLLALENVRIATRIVTDKAGKDKLVVKKEVTGLSDIFTKRTINAPPTIEHVDTPEEALMASLGVHARINWPFMARITGQTADALKDALVEKNKVFIAPDGTYVLAEDYLSGDVVTKLDDARAALADTPGLARNIAALEAEQPAPKTADQIQMPLGAHWIPTQYVQQWMAEELSVDPEEVSFRFTQTEHFSGYTPTFGGNVVRAGYEHRLMVRYGPKPSDPSAPKPYKYGFTDLVEAVMGLKQPTLEWQETVPKDGGGTKDVTRRDEAATLAARGNAEIVRSMWTTWLYSQPEILDDVVRIYNDRYNRTVLRSYDGSHLNHLDEQGKRTAALPGLALPFRLHPHQLRAVWRVLSSGNTLLAHEVGAGKTFEMIVAAMEMRRTGRARKPLITVPTYLLAAWREDIVKAYPNAKVLAFEEKDLSADKRQQAMARIAHGDWDIVLVPHSSFQLLKVSDERMIGALEAMVRELEDAEVEMRQALGDDDRSVKQIAAAKARMQNKVQKKLDKANAGSKDNALTWEQLGVDALLVDEAHAFKNLYFFSRVDNIRGLSRSEADKSLDLLLKIQDINAATNYRNVVLATATPVMNSLAEVYTMQRYLQPQRLEQHGFHNFDNWYRTFADAKPVTEKRPDGRYQEVMRVAKFRNLRLLYQMAAEVMDYVGWEDMPYLKLPQLKDNKITIVTTDQHPIYSTLRQWFEHRMAAIRELPPYYDKNKKVYIAPTRMHPITGASMGVPDNILTIMNDAKLAAVDPRLVVPGHATDVKGSRLQVATTMVADYYKREKAKKGVALMFLDVGTPKDVQPLDFLKGVTVDDETGGDALGTEDDVAEDDDDAGEALSEEDANGRFNLYDAVKDALVKKGIPAQEVAFVHQARTAAERLALFEAARAGKIRVLLASTDKGGVGMNIQERLGLLVEMDAPRAMRPGDIRQRHGRIIRQGNTYSAIEILRFVTKDTTDEWLYGLLGKKQAMITDFMRGNLDEFVDEDPSAMSTREAELRATGDPRALELIELQSGLGRMEAQAAAEARAVADAKRDMAMVQPQIATMREQLGDAEAWVREKWREVKGAAFAMTVGDTEHTKRDDANKAVISAAREMAEQVFAALVAREKSPGVQGRVVGTINGAEIVIRPSINQYSMTGEVAIRIAVPDIEADAYAASIIIPSPYDPEIRESNGKLPKTWGDGRNIVASIVGRYNELGHVARDAAEDLKKAEQKVARAEKTLANPTSAVDKYAKAKSRVEEIEQQLKAEADARDKALEAQRRDEGKTATKDARGGVGPQAPSGNASVGDFNQAVAGVAENPVGGPDVRAFEFPELVELARELIGDLTIVKKFRGTADKRGDFSETHGIRLHAGLFRFGMEFQLAATLAHEIGHLVDWLPTRTLKRGNILGRLQSLRDFLRHHYDNQAGTRIERDEVRAELQALSDWWRPWDPSKVSASFANYRKSSKELYADAISVLLNSPRQLKRRAPIFYAEFFEQLDRKPDVKSAYFGLLTVLSGTREELVTRRRENVRAMFEHGNDTALRQQQRIMAERREARKHVWARFRQHLVDNDYPVRDRVKARPAASPDKDPRLVLEELRHLAPHIKAWLEEHVQPIQNQLNDADVDWSTFGEVLFYERILAGDREEVANPNGIQEDAAREMYQDLIDRLGPDRAQAVKDAAVAFRRVMRAVAEDAYRAGLYTPALYEKMQANPAYVTFQVIEHMDNGVSSRVFKQVGTTKWINHPAEATILKAMVTIRAAAHNRAKTTTFEYLHQAWPSDIRQAKEVGSAQGRRPVDPEPKDRDKWELITYLERGRLRGKYVDPYVAQSLNQEQIGHTFAVVRVLRSLHNGFFRPVFTTVNLGFQAFNLKRDFDRMYKNTPQFRSYLRTMGAYFGKPATLARIRAFGMPANPQPKHVQALQDLLEAEKAKILTMTMNDRHADRAVEDTQFEDILARSGVGSFKPVPWTAPAALGPAGPGVEWTREMVVRYLLDPIRQLGDFIETLPKATALYQYKGDGPIADMPADVRSHIRRNIGSPDYKMGGTYKPIINETFLFANAIIQGVRADVAMAVDPTTRAGWWWKTVKVNILPKLLMAAAAAGLFGGGDGDDDDWSLKTLFGRVTEYDLTNYLIVPLGNDRGNTWYLRIPQDDTGRLIGAMVWKALGAATGRGGDLWSTLGHLVDYTSGQLPGVSPAIKATVAAAQYASGQNPYDSFRNRFVLTPDEQKARDWGTLRKFLGWEFQTLGGGIVWRFTAGGDRPEEKTTGQKIIELPVVSNTLGRFIRITNYGESEKNQRAKAAVERDEARLRRRVKDDINAALTDYFDRGLEGDGPLMAAAREISTKHGKEFDAVLRSLRMGRVKGSSDELADDVVSASSNAQKAAMIAAAKPSGTWLRQARDAGVISEPLAQLLQRQGITIPGRTAAPVTPRSSGAPRTFAPAPVTPRDMTTR